MYMLYKKICKFSSKASLRNTISGSVCFRRSDSGAQVKEIAFLYCSLQFPFFFHLLYHVFSTVLHYLNTWKVLKVL